ncbi:MAG: 2-hydroxyacyl-CoA dehydratase [Desulfatibacillum sp.]|nr:2-hydroxyacyl-CoA dehydratase [Desulfatibacillum sp.]
MNIHSSENFSISRAALRASSMGSLFSRYPRALGWVKRLMLPLALEKETAFNRHFRFFILMAGYAMSNTEDIRALGVLSRDFQDYLENVIDETSDKPMVWSEWNLSNEILRAFDVRQYVPETFAVVAQMAGSDAAVDIIELAEEEGMAPEHCSAAKTAVGALLANEAPKPDVIISSSHPCDSVTSSYQALQYMTKAPMFVVDTPYWDDDQSFKHYENNLWDLVAFLETNLNQKLDWDKLREVCENVNITNHYLQELSEMSRAVPSPTSVEPLLLHWLGRMAAFGSPNGMKFAELVHNGAKERLKKKQSIISEEKIRMIWYDVPLVFAPLFPWLEKKFGAVVVSDFMGRIQTVPIDTSSKETMIRDLARTHLYCTMVRHTRGPAEFYMEEFQKIIEEYSGDCFIFMGHQGCKGGWALRKLFRDVCRDARLPSLFVSSDIFDKRHVTEEEVKRQFEDFFRSNGLA